MMLALTLTLLVLVAVLLVVRRRDDKHAPGPRPWPVLGSLHLLGRYDVPFEAFTALAKEYGDIYSITLGSTACVVVNNFQLIKEVLITKGSHFGGRPDFIRFHTLFGGDRNNSLALCDWSDLQKTRRSIARLYCSPRLASAHYDHLDQVGRSEVAELLQQLGAAPQPCAVKPLLQAACFNMFTQYMCSTRFRYDDAAAQRVIRTFDEIFWEINQGYAVDFLPWLAPAYRGHMRRISVWSRVVRHFILARIVRCRVAEEPPRDFTDALLLHLRDDPHLSWDHIIFELEDFLGGHSAIGNLVMLALAAVVRHREVGARIQAELDAATGRARSVTLFDKAAMPYTESTILETLRTASSPIVPHVATQDTSIAGYAVDKGTVVFLNNYELNSSEECWEAPREFRPERFIVGGKVVKPEHFIPFSTGKRTCIGQRLVQGFAFIILASILQQYDVTCHDLASIRTYPACVAVPADTFSLVFTPRSVQPV